MKNEPLLIAFCSQKGGIGKSTFTILAASYLHYVLGKKVAVVDCDYPQYSIYKMREREKEKVGQIDFYKRLAYVQFQQGGKKAYPVLDSTPEGAIGYYNEYVEEYGEDYEIILFDLPGTVNTDGVLSCISVLDYIFIPVIADRLVLASSLSFASFIQESFVRQAKHSLKGVYLFWNRVDLREKTDLYEKYEKVFTKFELPLLGTRIPDTKRFNKDITDTKMGLFRSTLFPPDSRLLRGSNLNILMEEICELIKIQD